MYISLVLAVTSGVKYTISFWRHFHDSRASVPAFLFGSIPTGYVIAMIKGVDLRKVGSGNIGATNVLRAMGKGAAIITLQATCSGRNTGTGGEVFLP